MIRLSQRALTASEADAALFADRADELARVRRALTLRFNVYLLGPSGSGLTSLLHQVERDLGSEAVYVNAARASSVAELVRLVAGALGSDTTAASATLPADPLERLRTATTERGQIMTVLLDGAGRQVHHALFGRQRDELWEIPLRWVVSGHAPLVAPADAFFETVVRLAPLDEAAMRELLERRAGVPGTSDPAETRRLANLAERLPPLLGEAWPRALLGAARTAMLGDDPDTALADLQRRRDARSDLSETAVRVLEALEALGPVHAGDERLLDEIGTTRSRITQVFKELEAAGLVTSERSGKRRLYAPATGSFTIEAHITEG